MPRPYPDWRSVTSALACAIALVTPSFALGDASPAAESGATKAPQMRVHVDPTTGAILPDTPPEADEAAGRAVTVPAAEPTPVRAPGGGMMIVVPEDRGQSFRGTRDADGQMHIRCDDAEAGRP
jgi:hypothetical protein